MLQLTSRKFYFRFYESHTFGFYLSLYPAATVLDKAVKDQQQQQGHNYIDNLTDSA